jgi:hypothetical protein
VSLQSLATDALIRERYSKLPVVAERGVAPSDIEHACVFTSDLVSEGSTSHLVLYHSQWP